MLYVRVTVCLFQRLHHMTAVCDRYSSPSMYSHECDDVDSPGVGIDEALVTVTSELNVSVWSQSDECSQVSLCL